MTKSTMIAFPIPKLKYWLPNKRINATKTTLLTPTIIKVNDLNEVLKAPMINMIPIIPINADHPLTTTLSGPVKRGSPKFI